MIRYVAFGIVIDDLAFEDGRQVLGVLGGGGPQAAFGMRLWGEGVGLVAAVGTDWPAAHRAQLEAAGIDLGGVITGPWPTLRAWQIYGSSGKRRHEWQIAPERDRPDWARCLALAPADYRAARGYHLGLHPETADLNLVRQVRGYGGCLSLELFRPASHPLDEAALRALASAPDILSLNLEEARSICAPDQAGHVTDMAYAMVRCLHRAGARMIALRLGPEGALISDGQAGRAWHIPAFPTTVADPTGAGNAFSGAFLVGYVETGDLLIAGLWGSVAASLIIEGVGFPRLDAALRLEARRRVQALRSQAQAIQL